MAVVVVVVVMVVDWKGGEGGTGDKRLPDPKHAVCDGQT